MLVTPWAGILLLAYPMQVLRLAMRYGWERGCFTVLAKFPEAQGVVQYHWNRLRKRRSGLIEYK
jgi:hypothetical protein